MMRSTLTAVMMTAGISGCSTALPIVDLGGATLPRSEMFRYGVDNTSASTLAYDLSPTETADIKRQFSSVFQDGRWLEFGPMSARQKMADRRLVVCGLVEIRESDGKRSGMRLFDGIATLDPVSASVNFTPRHIAGANAKAIDVYSDCRDAGLLGMSPKSSRSAARPSVEQADGRATGAPSGPTGGAPAQPPASPLAPSPPNPPSSGESSSPDLAHGEAAPKGSPF